MIVGVGLDVPNANTMFVHDADRFGLAQLYQLRGRVGRSAPAGLLLPAGARPDRRRTPRSGCKVLEHHTELGAGYRIALKDLELRGAGNLLGAEQSGHARPWASTCTCAGSRRRCRRSGARAAGEQPRAARGGARPPGPPAGRLRGRRRRRSSTSTADWRGAATSGDIEGLRDGTAGALRAAAGRSGNAARHGAAPGDRGARSDCSMCWCGATRPASRSAQGRSPGWRASRGARRCAARGRGPPHGAAVARLARLGGEAVDAGAGAGAESRHVMPAAQTPILPEISCAVRCCAAPGRAARGCTSFEDAFTARRDMAAEAGSLKLPPDTLARSSPPAQRHPAQRETGRASSPMSGWTTRCSPRRRPRASSRRTRRAPSKALWPQVAELRTQHWHDSLAAKRGQPSAAAIDSAYNGNDLRIFQHILIGAPPVGHARREGGGQEEGRGHARASSAAGPISGRWRRRCRTTRAARRTAASCRRAPGAGSFPRSTARRGSSRPAR